ncbi:unnamed protein product [Didymodactylos carnosus]|nr:unnamed protein product [Didymodactylos carnosus]CAF3766161.1 unnamed protein product [Didymodactylos carnosus]
MPESMKHYWTKISLCEILKKASSKHTTPPIDVLVEIPVIFDSDLFQPHITIVDRAKYVNRCRCNPTNEMVLTVIEVSLSSLMDDVNNKVFRYAAANAKEVWVVDLLPEVVHVYEKPKNGVYQSVTILTVDKFIEFCGKKIPVCEIFRENGRGRKRKTSKEADELIVKKIATDRRKSSKVIRQEVATELGVTISERTTRRRLNEVGYYGQVARKKPLTKQSHRLKRLGYSYSYSTKKNKFWETVIWSDEAKFNLFRSDGKIMVWRAVGEVFSPVCIVSTVAHGGGNLIVWGCMSRKGVDQLVFIEGSLKIELRTMLLY